MAWAQELKSLVEEIGVGHSDRARYLKSLSQQVKALLKDAQDFMARTARELDQMAKELRGFLQKSETTRKEDYTAMMKGIQADIKKLQKETADIQEDARGLIARFQRELKQLATDLKAFLSKGEHLRMEDFKDMMRTINSDIEALRKATASVRKDAVNLVGGFAKERHEAAAAWATLGGKRAGARAAAPDGPAHKRRGRPKKQ